MIISFLLNIAYSFIVSLLGLLPTGHIAQAILDAVGYFWAIGNSFSYILPMDTFLAAVIAVMAFEVFVLLWSLLGWIIRKIPGMQS